MITKIPTHWRNSKEVSLVRAVEYYRRWLRTTQVSSDCRYHHEQFNIVRTYFLIWLNNWEGEVIEALKTAVVQAKHFPDLEQIHADLELIEINPI